VARSVLVLLRARGAVPRPAGGSGVPFSGGGLVDNAVPTPAGWTKCSPFVPCSGKAPTNYGRTNYICAGYVRPCANFFFPSEFCPSPSLTILPLLPSRRLTVSLDLASGSQPDISSCTAPSLLRDVFCSPWVDEYLQRRCSLRPKPTATREGSTNSVIKSSTVRST
jgi:hypothetical protein